MSIRKKLLGDRAFYRKVFAIAVPVMIQMGITNFVSLLDNIMVGRLGTEAMSGVSIVNQYIFVFNLLILGAISGAGIFLVQYHGSGDAEGERYGFRFKLIICALATVLGLAVFGLFDRALISTFLYDGSATGDVALTMEIGREYLKIMLWGFVPYALSQVYASTLRETEQTVVPMVASVAAVVTNFVLNCILIFGAFGAPALGAAGAAIATVISRFVELLILFVWAHTHMGECRFLVGAYRSLYIPRALVGKILVKGMPLMVNEVLWSLSMTLRNQCYATRGLDAVAAQNISSTILNVFSVFYMSFGTVISILVGSLLGAGELKKARDVNRKLLVCSVAFGTLLGALLAATSWLFPQFYQTEPHVRELAMYMIILNGIFMPFYAYAYASYFSVRSGGRVGITFLMDAGYMWLCVIPAVFVLSRFTALPILPLFAIGQGIETLKAAYGAILICRGKWLNRLID